MKLKLKSFENYFLKWRKAHLSMSHLYYTDSKLRIFSSFRPKNSSFCSMCYSYILSTSFGLDRITTNR